MLPMGESNCWMLANEENKCLLIPKCFRTELSSINLLSKARTYYRHYLCIRVAKTTMIQLGTYPTTLLSDIQPMNSFFFSAFIICLISCFDNVQKRLFLLLNICVSHSRNRREKSVKIFAKLYIFKFIKLFLSFHFFAHVVAIISSYVYDLNFVFSLQLLAISLNE
jgi:hypothetical protein